MIMECSYCHSAIPDSGRFCPSCGKEVATELPSACANCGQPLGPGELFCTVCGTRTAAQTGPLPAPEGAQPPAQAATTPYPTSYPYPANTVLKGQSSSSPHQEAGDTVDGSFRLLADERPHREGRPAIFWIPFTLILLLSLLFFWVANTSLQGWAVLTVGFILLFIFRRPLSRAGILNSIGLWVIVLIVLFFVLIATTTPRIG